MRNLPPTSLESDSAKNTGNVNLHLNTDTVHLLASYWLNLFLLHQSRGSRSILLHTISSIREKRDFLGCAAQRKETILHDTLLRVPKTPCASSTHSRYLIRSPSPASVNAMTMQTPIPQKPFLSSSYSLALPSPLQSLSLREEAEIAPPFGLHLWFPESQNG